MKPIDPNEIRDLWLKKYHNTTSAKLIEKHPPEVLQSADWFKLYPCTQEQHDEWVVKAKALLKKKYKVSDFILKKGWWFVYLQLAPTIVDNKTEDNNG